MMKLPQRWLCHAAKAALFVPILLFATGCQERPERTEDPAEIEELRQQHIEQAEREMRESS